MSKELNEDEIDETMDLLGNNYANSILHILRFKTISGSFRTYMFKPELSPLCWWTSHAHFLHKKTIDLITLLLTVVASSAGVESFFNI